MQALVNMGPRQTMIRLFFYMFSFDITHTHSYMLLSYVVFYVLVPQVEVLRDRGNRG